MSIACPPLHHPPNSLDQQTRPDFSTELPVVSVHCKPSENRRRRLEARQKSQRKEKELIEPYTPFFVPDSLLRASSEHGFHSDQDHTARTPSQVQTHSSLYIANLPTEILLLIVDHISVPYFQVCLALTCKRLATIISQNRSRLSPWRGYLDKEGLYRLLTKPSRRLSFSSSSPPSQQLALAKLRHHSLTALPTRSYTQSKSSDPYIPPSYRLCRACFRHIPRDPNYWQMRMQSPEYDDPAVNWYDITNFFGEAYRNCGQHKCPECCVRGYTAFGNEGAYLRRLREETEELPITLMCPELKGRVGRP